MATSQSQSSTFDSQSHICIYSNSNNNKRSSNKRSSNNNCESNCCCDYFHCKLLWNFTYNSLPQNMEIAHATPPPPPPAPAPLALPRRGAACHLPLAAKPPATAAVTCRINLSAFSLTTKLPSPPHTSLPPIVSLLPQPKLNSLVWHGPGLQAARVAPKFCIYKYL